MIYSKKFVRILNREETQDEKLRHLYVFFGKLDTKLFREKTLSEKYLCDLKQMYLEWIRYTKEHPEILERLHKFYVDIPYCLQVGREVKSFML